MLGVFGGCSKSPHVRVRNAWPRTNRQQRRELPLSPHWVASSAAASASHSSATARPPGLPLALASPSSAAEDE